MLRTLAYASLLALAGCVGAAPDVGDPSPDAPPPPPPDPVLPRVNGTALDYFTAQPLSGVLLSTEGMQPEQTATSDARGTFSFAVPPGTVFYLGASRDNFRPTRSGAVRVVDRDVTTTVTVVSVNDARRQYSTLGLSPVAGQAVLFADLRRNDGSPLLGVPLTDITLTDAQLTAVGKGPFFFGQTGDLVSNATLSTSTAFDGRARVGFLDVPPGSYTLKVKYVTGGGGGGGGGPTTIATFEVPVVAVADGAILAQTGGSATPPPAPSARTFTTDIHPRLQKAAAGGLGCANCHCEGGLAAFLKYDVPAADAYAAIMARPGVVSTATPAQSLLLTKPLYEDPANHPNATFLDTNDPDYQVFLQWIAQGAAQ